VNVQNKDKWTALMLAAAKGHVGVVRLLVEAKADLNVQDKRGRTALTVAIRSRSNEVAKMLQNTTKGG
jgi:ankyrin repeat protein